MPGNERRLKSIECIIPPNQVLIRGKSLGTTNLYLWGANRKLIQVLDIEVTHDLGFIKSQVK